MWLFKKKQEKKEAEEGQAEEAGESGGEQEGESAESAVSGDVSSRLDMLQADITKINGAIESFKEIRKSTSERFATINEQIGELRGMVNDTQRTVGMVEVKATKAADLVESVHPDKLMIQVQKEDGKIEGLRGMLEAKEEMMRNIMDQLKKLREQINVFRGIEQVIKLNEEVKDELMSVKKIAASVERHADRVDNVFIESQKSFEAFNTFADKLDGLRADLKDLTAKTDKIEVATGAFIKKKEFEDRMEKIEKSDKKVKNFLKEVEDYYASLGNKFKQIEGQMKLDFDFKLKKAEIMSNAFGELLKENPLLAKDLGIDAYIRKQFSAQPVGGSVALPEQNSKADSGKAKTGEAESPANK